VSTGPKIVFGSVRNNNNHDVFVMDPDGNNQSRLTTSLAYDDQPKWSPDGSKIVFMSGRDGNFEIYSMNADGTAQTRLTNNPAADGFQHGHLMGQRSRS
jgi:Tol biopolymer transport system component